MESSTVADSRFVCLVCRKQFSQYTCPRCNVRYCSLRCYKSHSTRCVESFSRDNVVANMQDCVASPETRRRMLKALHHFHRDSTEISQDDDDVSSSDGDHADEDGDYESRRRGCILSDATLDKIAAGMDIQPEDLSEEERKAFSQALFTGKLSHLIIPWEPWWLSPSASQLVLTKDGMRVVQPIEHSDSAGNGQLNIPLPLEVPLPPLRDLSAKPPSSLLGVHLVEVLYSYCFTLRFLNGDWTCDNFNGAQMCLSVSRILSNSSFPQSVSEALNDCFVTICSAYFKSIGGFKFGLALLDDVIALLRARRPAVICALSDLHRMLEKAVKDFKKEGSKSVLTPRKGHRKLNSSSGLQEVNIGSRSELKAVCKKVFFLLCWTNEQPPEAIISLAVAVEDEKAQISDRHEKEAHDAAINKRPFIEDITRACQSSNESVQSLN